ncbi:hypothetical protein CYMTET_40492 [Cymbomonas tetramitiformis]|uniref:tRNA(His) guanylyltransferase n=1 Tax=Cymbomonas tetramitiformis TaxID=36881 RepID=A0AAE0C9R7_9CHLO|nr:hypothetical protein CYMTET_40492 [Cymbomonas tetramitiformis]
MANSRFEYVKSFELEDRLLPHCWIVFRIDGKGFTKFCDAHQFQKPNDSRALLLANTAAKMLMEEHSEIVLGYGQSDEYSFVLRKNTELYNRRSSKLISVFVSYYTAAYVSQWPTHFPDVPLQYLPSFDGRTVCYPSNDILRDYLSWRQADCHINNQYNTCFWALVHSGKKPSEAQGILKVSGHSTWFKRACKVNVQTLIPGENATVVGFGARWQRARGGGGLVPGCKRAGGVVEVGRGVAMRAVVEVGAVQRAAVVEVARRREVKTSGSELEGWREVVERGGGGGGGRGGGGGGGVGGGGGGVEVGEGDGGWVEVVVVGVGGGGGWKAVERWW